MRTMSSPVSIALGIAYAAHKDQKDKQGLPYVGHLLRVAARVSDDPDAIAVALLHDVLEDTPVEFKDLMVAGLPDVVCRAVVYLTHLDCDTYQKYLDDIKTCPGEAGRLARRVKLADLADNLDPRRWFEGKPESWDEKYKAAVIFLGGSL